MIEPRTTTMPLFADGKPTWLPPDGCPACQQQVETMTAETEPIGGRQVVRMVPCGHQITAEDFVTVTLS